MRCPCRKKSETVSYSDCCGRYHAGLQAPTAEALMRSRYTAFALRDEAYLVATWHPTTRPERLDLAADQEWLLLRIAAVHTDGHEATVEFTARSKINGRSHVLHELSNFLYEPISRTGSDSCAGSGRWYYLDGEAL